MEKIKEEKTLVGIIIISWFFRVAGCIMVLLGILIPLSLLSLVEVYGNFSQFGWILFIGIGLVLILLGVLYFFVGRGLNKLKPWARTTTIVLEVLQIVISLILIIFFIEIISNIFSLVISGIVLYYLNKKDVKNSFKSY